MNLPPGAAAPAIGGAPLDLLQGYPVVIRIPVAWGEMDSFAHVNNIVYFRYFESARIEYFARLGYMDHREAAGVGPILASTQCRFRVPLTYPDVVQVGARVPEVEDDRFLMQYRVASERRGKVAAEGDGLIVSFDYRAGHKVPVPDLIRERIRALEGRQL